MSERRPELPDGWEWCALEDVAEVRLGRQRSPKNHSGSNMVPYLRAANVTWSGFDLTDVKEMHFSEEEEVVYALKPGDILVSEASGSASEVGKPAIWQGEVPRACFQNTLLRVRSDGPLPEYLAVVLREAAVSGRFGQAAAGVGIHHLGAGRLSKWMVPLPPRAEQSRVVAALDALMAEIRSGVGDVRKASAALDFYIAAAFRDVFARAGEDVVRPLGDVAEVRSGLTKGRRTRSEVAEYPFLRAANVRKGELDLTEIKTIPATAAEVERFRLLSGDVLMIEGSGSASRLGQGWVWEGQIDDCLHQNHVFRARPDQDILDPLYLAWFLQSQQARHYFLRHAKTTAGLSTINRTQVAALPVPIPSVAEQRDIVRSLGRIADQVDRLEAALAEESIRAKRLERALLVAAISGGLTERVEGDEPAVEAVRAIAELRHSRKTTRGAKNRRAVVATG